MSSHCYIPSCRDDNYATGSFLLPFEIVDSYEFSDVIFDNDVLEDNSITKVKVEIDADKPIGDFVFNVSYVCIKNHIFSRLKEFAEDQFKIVEATLCRRNSLSVITDGYTLLIPIDRERDLCDSSKTVFSGELFGKRILTEYYFKQSHGSFGSIIYCSIGGWLFSSEFHNWAEGEELKGFSKLLD